MLASFLLLWYKLSIKQKSCEREDLRPRIRQRESATGCKPTWDVPQCSPGSCREEMRGRVIPRYRENECAGFAAKLGGTTEAVCLSSQVIGRKGFFRPKNQILSRRNHMKEKLKQLLLEGQEISLKDPAN